MTSDKLDPGSLQSVSLQSVTMGWHPWNSSDGTTHSPLAVSKVSIKTQLLLMDQIPVKTHKSNYDDKTAQFNLAAVKMLQLSPAPLRVLA